MSYYLERSFFNVEWDCLEKPHTVSDFVWGELSLDKEKISLVF